MPKYDVKVWIEAEVGDGGYFNLEVEYDGQVIYNDYGEIHLFHALYYGRVVEDIILTVEAENEEEAERIALEEVKNNLSVEVTLGNCSFPVTLKYVEVSEVKER